MDIKDYVALRIAQLKHMQAQFEGYNKEDPEGWPLEMSAEDWAEQAAEWHSTADTAWTRNQ